MIMVAMRSELFFFSDELGFVQYLVVFPRCAGIVGSNNGIDSPCLLLSVNGALGDL